jgi:DNA-binding transcriptional ArsR family regulator
MKTDLDQADTVRISMVCKALASPVRVQIVCYIQQHPGCIGNQILLNLPHDAVRAQSTLSQHLKILCRAGLIEAEPDGPATTYLLSQTCLEWLRTRLGELEPVGARLVG